MKKHLTILVILLALAIQTQAQTNIQTMSAKTIFGAEASFLNPSFLKDTRGFQLNFGPFMGANILVGNNFESIGNIIDLAKSENKSGDDVNFAPIHSLMDNLKPINKVWAQVDFTLLNATFRVGKPGKSLNVGLSLRQHVNGNISLNDEFLRLLYEGNKQFAGQTVKFSPRISTMAYTDIGTALSKTLKVGDFSLTPGIRVRYLLGNAALYTQKADLSFYTEPNGEYIELGGNLNASTGAVDFNNTDNLILKNLTHSFGNGFAIDLGITAEYKNMSFSIASIDNGSIRFKKDNAWNVTSTGATRWDGYDILAEHEGRVNDGIFGEYTVDTVKKEFRTGIGSKITLNGNYGIQESIDKKGNKFYKHNLGISYIQGLSNKYNATTAPQYALYYQYILKNRYSAGININGYENVTDLGFNIGARIAGLNVGLGTNNLTSIIDLHSGKQASLFFMLGFAF